MTTPGDAPATLVFVYNADDGLLAALADAVHKVVSPGTYPCSLCAITYGAVSMKPAWRAYLKALPYTTRFLHRQGFARAYPGLTVTLPAVLLDAGGSTRVLIDAGTLDGLRDVDGLIAALEAALAGAPE